MAKQPKPKPKTEANSNRKNGKANKRGTVKHRSGKIDPIMAIIMGKGVYVNIAPKKKTATT